MADVQPIMNASHRMPSSAIFTIQVLGGHADERFHHSQTLAFGELVLFRQRIGQMLGGDRWGRSLWWHRCGISPMRFLW